MLYTCNLTRSPLHLSEQAVRAPCCDRPFNKIKAFIFVHDVDETTGPFAVLPGSHRMDQGRTFRDSSGVERTAGTEIQARAAGERGDDPSEAMPGHVKFVGRAGDVLLWNGALFHAAMHNTDDKPRVVLLYNFVQASSGVIAQRTPEFRTGRSVDVSTPYRIRCCTQYGAVDLRMPLRCD
jgi:ectoine hydroxylase-related dioxygenase (phytanoyl-CoA dioxygenase family)